jgi:hypothetical protein
VSTVAGKLLVATVPLTGWIVVPVGSLRTGLLLVPYSTEPPLADLRSETFKASSVPAPVSISDSVAMFVSEPFPSVTTCCSWVPASVLVRTVFPVESGGT